MKSQNKLRVFSEMICTVVPNVYHYSRGNKTYPCAVWQESDADVFNANNRSSEISFSGTLDYFTKLEFDTVIDAICDAFTENGIIWHIESVQYEEETGLIHYEWSWKM